jgi:D-alanine-D-alanine ligase
MLRYPLIIKPIAEGSSKGIAARGVVDDEPALRRIVKELIDKYKQPALVEEYISGREFTVGLLGDRRPRVLPPMEVLFKDQSNTRPIYDYEIKQDWPNHVIYQCPAKLTAQQSKAIERAARDTFQALDCRDVGRVDLRMDSQGNVYVLELNPLPGLTPENSDLVLIAKGAAMDYRTLIAEILSGGLKRLREKRRDGGVRSSNHTRASFAAMPMAASSETPDEAAQPKPPSPRKPAARSKRPAEPAAEPEPHAKGRSRSRKNGKSAHSSIGS